MQPGICNYQDALSKVLRVSLFLGELLLLLSSLTVAAHELVDATSGVDELALTSVERVRGA